MAQKTYELQGFLAETKRFKDVLLPKKFTAFQKWIALELYRRIMQKTPVDKGFLRGSWTISVGAQDKSAANSQTDAKSFETRYGGEKLTKRERIEFTQAVAAMNDLQIGQIIWLNNAMPYVLVIEFEKHSELKAPGGMVQISINEMKTWLQTAKRDFVKISENIT